MTDLYRLVYTSRNLIEGTEQEHLETVNAILAASQRNNGRVGVTGALMFNGGSFAQVLEGPRRAVETTFERIQRDPRHGDVGVLQCEPVAERGFPDWSMSFVGQSPRGRAMWDSIASRTGFDLARIEGETLFGILHAIVLEEEGAASEPSAPQPVPREPAARADPERVEKLDVERLRSELGAVVERTPARPAPSPAAQEASTSAADAATVAVLRAALAEERTRTTALRESLDEARIALAVAADRHQDTTRQRDIWAERARALASALCRDPDEHALDGPDPVAVPVAGLRGAA